MSNLALPGSGSLVAGRISGYAQLALGMGGLVMTVGFGLRFMLWYFANWSRLNDSQGDMMAVWGDLWLAGRWAFLGILVFGAGWLWGLATGLHLLHVARKSESTTPPPPRLT